MCRSTAGQRWRVIGERFNQMVNALIMAAYHANLCGVVRISDNIGRISGDRKLDLVDNKENLHA